MCQTYALSFTYNSFKSHHNLAMWRALSSMIYGLGKLRHRDTELLGQDYRVMMTQKNSFGPFVCAASTDFAFQ